MTIQTLKTAKLIASLQSRKREGYKQSTPINLATGTIRSKKTHYL